MAQPFKLGLDFHGTITSHPGRFRKLAQAVLDGGGTVYIITAVAPQNRVRVLTDIRATKVPFTAVDVVTFTDYAAVPALKLAAAKDRQLDLFIDDRADTCQLLTDRGISGLVVSQKGKAHDHQLRHQPRSRGLAPEGHPPRRHRGIGRPLGALLED